MTEPNLTQSDNGSLDSRKPNEKLSSEEKAEILADFWDDRYSATVNYSSMVESKRGFWVDKEMQFSTNRGMFVSSILIIIVFSVIHIFWLHAPDKKQETQPRAQSNLDQRVGTDELLPHANSSPSPLALAASRDNDSSQDDDESSTHHHLIDILWFILVSASLLVLTLGIRTLCCVVFCLPGFRVDRKEFLKTLQRPEYLSVIDGDYLHSLIHKKHLPASSRLGEVFYLIGIVLLFFGVGCFIWVTINIYFQKSWKTIAIAGAASCAFWLLATFIYEVRRGYGFLATLQRTFFINWVRLTFFTPFGYKYIWWWTLIAGIATAEIDYLDQVGSGHQPTGFGLSFMRAIIISVIAYIATNIIRELLLLRGHYVKGVDIAEKGNLIANQLTSTLATFSKKDVPKLIDISRIAIRSVDIGKRLSGLDALVKETTGPEYAALHQQSIDFQESVYTQIDNFVAQITEPSGQFVKRCLLLTLNRYLINETETLNTRQKHLITRFSTLAEIARELVEASYPGESRVAREEDAATIEFYALLVIPPVKFLNYDHKRYIGDHYWETYLQGLMNSAKREIPQKRFFVSLSAAERTDLQIIDNVPSQEAPDLFSEDIADQLNKFVKVDEEGIPQHEPADVNDKRHYVFAGPPKGEGWRRFGDVLNSVYHVPDDCFIREFSREEFAERLWDKDRKRPFDYFAIRSGSGWIFCLQARYDKGLDVADIEVFYEGMSNPQMSEKWQLVKKNLDLVFFPASNVGVFPINAYGK